MYLMLISMYLMLISIYLVLISSYVPETSFLPVRSALGFLIAKLCIQFLRCTKNQALRKNGLNNSLIER